MVGFFGNFRLKRPPTRLNLLHEKQMNLINPILLILLTAPLLGACKEPTFPAQLVAYNHSNTPIYFFTVNGTVGPNAMPHGGGGKFSCCVSLPEKWKPGMHAKITWEYDRMKESDPQLPPQSIEIAIPKYKRPGDVHVHFYENHKIKMVISSCSAGHPFYPMDPDSLLPWKANRTKEEYLKYENTNGDNDAC